MSDLNKFVFTARLGRDAVKTQVGANNTTKVDLVLCNNTYRSKKDYVNFLNASLWGSRGENLFPYLKKGTLVSIDSHIFQQRYETEGKKHSQLVIEIDDIQLLGATSGKNQSQPVSQEGTLTEPIATATDAAEAQQTTDIEWQEGADFF